jgi:hypothetical protein
VDLLWEQHTARRLDPAKYFPIEIVQRIFSHAVYYVEDLQSEGSWIGKYFVPSREITTGLLNGPLVLTSVSIKWGQIAATYPPLWTTILIDQSEEDCLEQVQLFLDCSGKELLDIVLLYHGTPNLPLTDFLIGHADRFKTFVSLLTRFTATFTSQMEIPKTPFMNWNIPTSRRHRVSTVPIPKCVNHLQLPWASFDSRSLIPFTYLHNLKYLSMGITHEPKGVQWEKKLQFKQLQYLRLDVTCRDENRPIQFTSRSLWIDWLECPALVDLSLSCSILEVTCDETYAHLEAWLLNLRSLQKLRVSISIWLSGGFDTARLENMERSTFNVNLELVELRLSGFGEAQLEMACTERFFSVFTPHTHLVWPYRQFPSPAIFTHLKTVHIIHVVEGDGSALAALSVTQVELPFLEELYLDGAMGGRVLWSTSQGPLPALLDLLRAPHLKSLCINGFIPLDLRHISNSNISSVSLRIMQWDEGPREVYLPCDHLHLQLPVCDLFQLKIHPSLNQRVRIKTTWGEASFPPIWTVDYVSEILGTVTDLTVNNGLTWFFSEAISSFLRPFVFLKSLELFCWKIGEATCIDHLAQRLPDPNFLPALEALSIIEYPSWPDFFQNIQQRQIGFLTGQFQSVLREVTIKAHVHGALLGHLRESLAGKYIGLSNKPPRRKGSKDWPVPPFSFGGVDTNGLLCCYMCQRAGLEIGCMVVHSDDAREMEKCARAQGKFGEELNRVFAP